jgi:hypothetical protein
MQAKFLTVTDSMGVENQGLNRQPCRLELGCFGLECHPAHEVPVLLRDLDICIPPHAAGNENMVILQSILSSLLHMLYTP